MLRPSFQVALHPAEHGHENAPVQIKEVSQNRMYRGVTKCDDKHGSSQGMIDDRAVEVGTYTVRTMQRVRGGRMHEIKRVSA